MKTNHKILIGIAISMVAVLLCIGGYFLFKTPKEQTQEYKDFNSTLSQTLKLKDEMSVSWYINDYSGVATKQGQIQTNLYSMKDNLNILKEKGYNVELEERVINLFEVEHKSVGSRVDMITTFKKLSAYDLMFNKENAKTILNKVLIGLEDTEGLIKQHLSLVDTFTAEEKNVLKQNFNIDLNAYKTEDERVLKIFVDLRTSTLNFLKQANN